MVSRRATLDMSGRISAQGEDTPLGSGTQFNADHPLRLLILPRITTVRSRSQRSIVARRPVVIGQRMMQPPGGAIQGQADRLILAVACGNRLKIGGETLALILGWAGPPDLIVEPVHRDHIRGEIRLINRIQHRRRVKLRAEHDHAEVVRADSRDQAGGVVQIILVQIFELRRIGDHVLAGAQAEPGFLAHGG